MSDVEFESDIASGQFGSERQYSVTEQRMFLERMGIAGNAGTAKKIMIGIIVISLGLTLWLLFRGASTNSDGVTEQTKLQKLQIPQPQFY